MRHSSHSQSRHELVSSHGRRSACSDRTETVAKHKRGNMKCIITVGILLPILAAIIGVAAWAVSGDSDRHGASHDKTHRPSFQRGHISRFHNDLVPVIEARNDLLYGSGKVPIGGAVSKDILGSDTVHEDEENQVPLNGDEYAPKPASSSSNEHPKDDPLYVVHYVPQDMKPEMATPSSATSTPQEDILSKILSSSKGSSNGTPQFVVFAPLPGEMAEKNARKSSYFENDYDDEVNEPQASARAMSKRVRVKKRRKGRKNGSFRDDFDSDGNGGSTKYRNSGSSSGQRSSVLPRDGQLYSDSRPSDDHSEFQPYDEENYHHGNFEPNHPIAYNQQNHMQMNQMQMQQHQQNQMGGNQNMQHKQGAMMCCYPNQGQQHQGQSQGHGQQMPMMPMRPVQQPQQPAPTRQPGLTISLGNGLPLGPLGVLRQMLRPVFDLRKKVFFGVQLENGFGFGGNNNAGGTTQGGATQGGGGGGGGNTNMRGMGPMLAFHTG